MKNNIHARARKYDASRYLTSDAHIVAYLAAAFEDGNPAVISAAIGNIARAKGMSDIAKETGLNRESLYRALGPDGNPRLATLLKVLQALGIQLQAAPIRAKHQEREMARA